MTSPRGQYPQAIRQAAEESLHGLRIQDPYRWLEDPADPRTLDWTDQQAALYQAERSAWADRELWRASLASLTDDERVLLPQVRGDRVFLRRLRSGEDHPVLFVTEDAAGRGSVERALLDPLAIDPAGRTVLEAWEPSPQGALVACQLSSRGTEDSSLVVIDASTGSTVDGPIGGLRRSSLAWLPGEDMLYYVRGVPSGTGRGADGYHRRVYLHRLGTSADDDIMVFGDGRDKTTFYTVAVTPDGRWLTVTAAVGTSPADVYLADLWASPLGAPRLVPVQEGAQCRSRLYIAPGTGPDDPMWLRTDLGAPRGRVVACTPAEPAKGAWRELIPERPDATLTDMSIVIDPVSGRPTALLTWLRHAVAEITVHDLADGRQTGVVPLPGTGSVSALVVPPGGHEAWFAYTDHATPMCGLHYDAADGEVRPWPDARADPAVPGVRASQVSFQSHDGTTVRMFIISAGARPDQPRPAIITGYGGFGHCQVPAFSPYQVAWARAGGIVAEVCLRGGGEEGEEWHRAGQRENKQNVFDDFDAAAGHLVEAGWSSPGQLAIMGTSNGGLLVAAALTQHPERYAAVVCKDALLDMVRYERSGLGLSWRPEYGTADDPDQLRVLLSYSPYHRVRPGTVYPPVLLTAADGDTRVNPLHARKMCAALQHASAGSGPVLLRLERDAGHGMRAQSRVTELHADCLAFLAGQVGLAPGGAW